MGEEKKGEGYKEEEKKEEEAQEIVLKVDMHCEACARKVARALKRFQGVEEVTTDYKTSKVIVKGKTADPLKVCERVQKKSGRKVELLSPLPKPPEEENKEEKKEEPKEEKKYEPPPVITVVLNVQTHCDACAQALEKRIRKIKGVESVTTNPGENQVVVKGIIDPEKLISDVYKRTGKQVSVVKEEEKKEGDEEGKLGEDIDKMTDMMKKSEYYLPPKYYVDQFANYPPQIFSDENLSCNIFSYSQASFSLPAFQFSLYML